MKPTKPLSKDKKLLDRWQIKLGRIHDLINALQWEINHEMYKRDLL